jgi:hypothetical protein
VLRERVRVVAIAGLKDSARVRVRVRVRIVAMAGLRDSARVRRAV